MTVYLELNVTMENSIVSFIHLDFNIDQTFLLILEIIINSSFPEFHELR